MYGCENQIYDQSESITSQLHYITLLIQLDSWRYNLSNEGYGSLLLTVSPASSWQPITDTPDVFWIHHVLISLCLWVVYVEFRMYLSNFRSLDVEASQQDVHGFACLCLHTGYWDAYEFCLWSYQKPSVMTALRQMYWPEPTLAFIARSVTRIPSYILPSPPTTMRIK